MTTNYRFGDSTTSGYLWLWGKNTDGQLGDNTAVHKSIPVQTIAGGNNWMRSSSGYVLIDQSAAIKTDGTLWTWGNNDYGQLGDNSITKKSSPVQTVAGGTNWKQVSVGYSKYIAAIKTDGTLWLWGKNTNGQLGDNTRTHKSSPVQTVAGGTNWQQVRCSGNNHTAAIKTDGTLWAWGNNSNGQLGDNTRTSKSSPVQTVAGGTDWKTLAVGQKSSYAIKLDGTLWSWGSNDYGGLGDNTIAHKSSPIQTVAGGVTWRQVSAGAYDAAAIKTDGTLWVWGRNAVGQLGDNTVDPKSSPIQTIAGGTTWKSVVSGYNNTAAIKTDGTLWAWGNNNYGQLGDNTLVPKSSPIQIAAGVSNWLGFTASGAVAAVTNWPSGVDLDDVYVRKDYFSEGGLWAWGYNGNGQLGDNTRTGRSSPVQTICEGTNWKQIASGGYHSGAIKTDGTLWTWGRNTEGQLGDNAVAHKSSPVQTVAGGTNWKQIAFNFYMSGAIKADGTLWTWGKNDFGQLGDNTVAHKSSPVQTVAGGTNWREIVAGGGGGHTVAIKTDGTLWLWGLNGAGQLGDNTVTKKSSPVQTIAGGTNWRQASTGTTTTAAIKTDGTLWTWGYNYYGTLGDNTSGSSTHKSSPIQTVAAGTNWKQVSSGGYQVAAIKTDGTLWVWGKNHYGQLGTNDIVNRSSPVQTVAGGTNWKLAKAGYLSAGAIKTDGTLWTWGYNGNGELGDNTLVNKSSPIQTVAGGTNWKSIATVKPFFAALTYDTV